MDQWAVKVICSFEFSRRFDAVQMCLRNVLCDSQSCIKKYGSLLTSILQNHTKRAAWKMNNTRVLSNHLLSPLNRIIFFVGLSDSFCAFPLKIHSWLSKKHLIKSHSLNRHHCPVNSIDYSLSSLLNVKLYVYLWRFSWLLFLTLPQLFPCLLSPNPRY